MQARAEQPVLQMRGIGKRFGALAALGGVDLEVHAGEVHALIGENGAGKSTLMKVLSGAHAPDSGSMLLAGERYAPRGPLQARALGVAMIYQELALAPQLTVAQNIVLGREPARFGWVDRAEQSRRVHEVLNWLAQPELAPTQKVAALSAGARQLVEVARALAGDARIVVMDEPTSSLSHAEVERLFAVIERLRNRGVAVIYISHFLEEVWRVAQRFTVLRDGKSVDSGAIERSSDASSSSPAPAFTARVIQAMAGRALTDVYPQVAHAPAAVAFECDALSGAQLPREATLAVRHGEILGIAGLVGAGRSELLRTLFGLDRVAHGRVRVHAQAGAWDHGMTPRVRLAQGVGLLSENRKEEGLALGLSIATNVTLSRPPARYGFVLRSAQQAVTRALAQRLGLRYQSDQQPVSQLSGGNQQKVALARLLHHGVAVLLLDEPTRGIDVGSKAEIYRLMGELAAQGKAIVFVSSYLPELLGVCDRIAVMNRGRLGEPRPRSEWSEASLLAAATAGSMTDERRTRVSRFLGPFMGLAAVVVLFASLAPDTFLSVYNFQTIAAQTVIVGLGAIGMTFVIVSGGIDLSVGSTIALASVVTAVALRHAVSPALAAISGVLAGGCVGLVNGAIITRLSVVPFIVTLGSMGVARGFAKYLAGEQKVDAPAGWLAGVMAKSPQPSWLLVAPGTWLMFALAVGFGLILRRSVFGVHTYAIGSNEATAHLCGVRVARAKLYIYMLSGLFAGFAGVMQYARLTVGDPTTALGKELDVIAAVVIGGASLAGGVGGILGSLIGAFLMSVLANGCTLTGVPNYVQEILIGMIIVAAVALDRLRARA